MGNLPNIDSDGHSLNARALARDLHSALRRAELRLVYQPLVYANGEVEGFEALLRWCHSKWGPISPAVFIPLAEEIGEIHEIGKWALGQACREAVSWAKPLHIAVNLSPIQLKDSGFAAVVFRHLDETGLTPSRLRFEVTEGAFIDDAVRADAILQAIRSIGAKIFIDDFGTGYSSFRYLKELSIDGIKIDRSFVMDLTTNIRSAAIVSAILQLGRVLSLDVTAEGVELEEQFHFLRAEGCTSFQGYYIGRALPIDEYFHLVGSGDQR